MLRYNGAMSSENQSTNIEILAHRHTRVEIHVLPLEGDVWAVMALSGDPVRVLRRKGQGPFPSRDAALAVASRIGEVLRGQGFVSVDSPPCWEMEAWRQRRLVINARSGSAPRTAFHPDDVIF